jgi:hypothetical protein
MNRPVVRRYHGNPILTKADVPYPTQTVHNAGVVKHQGESIMLVRSHLDTGRSIIGLARSADGFHFTADPKLFLTSARSGPFRGDEEFGVEDPRMVGTVYRLGVALHELVDPPESSASGTHGFCNPKTVGGGDRLRSCQNREPLQTRSEPRVHPC